MTFKFEFQSIRGTIRRPLWCCRALGEQTKETEGKCPCDDADESV